MVSINVFFDYLGNLENESFKPIETCCYKIQADAVVLFNKNSIVSLPSYTFDRMSAKYSLF